MKTPKKLHKKATMLYQCATMQKAKGENEIYLLLTRNAYLLEREAALMLKDDYSTEPTRSLLFRSAATLALKIGDYKAAKQLAYEGLKSLPSKDVGTELAEIIQQCNNKKTQ